ncbi:ABC transporter ATP-binding protein [Kurthia massiliensis]|uniref:ABC transporter ATP-binding protein n=1 Tax=Kurthia massiliensis TaxID=1033739 RepID=UPI000288BACB|nr:ABC transporter ATP-binding protein [Kurthia massiliensis]
MTFFKMDHIQKSFMIGKREEMILKDISLELEKGKITALTGPSGCGKSTLLTIAAGLQEATSGHLIVEGVDMTTLSAEQVRAIRAEKFGFVFQFAHLVPFLTVEEQLLLMLDVAGKSNEHVTELLQLVGMLHRKDAYPEMLSGGEKQRVAIARALIHQPMILFADEPTASLDSKRSVDVMLLLRKLTKQLNITTLIVTHDEDMLKYVDVVMKMKDGQLVKEG